MHPAPTPPTATSAEYVIYDYKSGTYSNPHGHTTISLDKKGTESSYQSSCDVSGGLGWIICPVTNFLANGMDTLFGLLASMVAVQPLTLTSGTGNGLYTSWNIMRNIANVAFVIAFLIIIFSQLTSVGVSNYGLKKLIPRLIVAAILVNLSFYVSAIAIDISNVLGYSIQDVFNGIRQQAFHITDDTFGGFINSGWTTLAGGVLGLGGITLGGMYLIANPGSLFLLIPLLVSLMLIILVVLVILAARQALIVVLVIVAPLAFVANLLPNTEKLFNKWKDLFMTMLIFFPAFSLVFGASQLAGQIIIQNAGDNLWMVIFGMAVQIAPLAITPLVLKLSGNVLGRVAQIVNNPKKGLLDRSKNWANDRNTLGRNNAAGRDLSLKRPTGTSFKARAKRLGYRASTAGYSMIQGSERRKRALKEAIEVSGQHAENRYKESARHRALHENMATANEDKDFIGATNDTHIERLRTTRGSSLYDRTLRTQAAKASLETAQNETKRHLAQQRLAGGALHHTVRPLEMSKLNAEAAESTYTAMVENMKLAPNSGMQVAAHQAQAAKEAVEAAQGRVQAQFDARRRVVGSELHTSTLDLTASKLTAETEKSLTTAYINAEKLAVGSDLHLQVIRSQQAKLAEQVSETRVNKMVEEYKSGRLVRTGELSTLMDSMKDDVNQLAAETQGVQAAQNIQKKNVAEEFMASTQYGEDLRTTAGSVDQNGPVRAKAHAISQLGNIVKEARDNVTTLLEEEAESNGRTLLQHVSYLFDLQRGQAKDAAGNLIPATPQDDSVLEAALDVLAREGDIVAMREARMDDAHIDQTMLTRVLGRNADSMRAKGGFDLQQDPNLAGATQEEMDVSIAKSLGSIGADKISGQKWGWWNYLGDPDPTHNNQNLERIIAAVEALPAGPDRDRAQDALRSTYRNMTTALSDPNSFRTIGDRVGQTAKIHEKLDAVSWLHDDEMSIDYDRVKKGQPDVRP